MRSQVSHGLENTEAVLSGLLTDNTEYIFREFLDLQNRYRFAQTCRFGLRLFANNLHRSLAADLRKALVENGFQVNSHEINFHELSIEHLLLFLSVLKYNYTLNREKRAYCEMLAAPHIQQINSLTFWRIAIFCDFLIRDIQINKSGISHAFVTTENLVFFKELIKHRRNHNDMDEIFLARLLALNTINAQPLLCETLRSDVNRKTYSSTLRLTDLGFLEEQSAPFPAETEIDATFKMKDAYALQMLSHLGFLYLADRRTAKWLSSLLRTTTFQDHDVYMMFLTMQTISPNSTDFVVRAGIAMQYFSALSSDRAKLLLLFLVDEFYEKSTSALNTLCLRFVSPLFSDYVENRIAHISKRDELEHIITNSLNLLSDTYWKPADWKKLSRSQLQIIQFVAENEFAMREHALCSRRGPRSTAFWQVLETKMKSRMEKLSYAFRPDSELWAFPENFLTHTLPTFSRRITPTDAVFLDPDLLINLSKKRTEQLPAPLQGLGRR